MQGLPILLLTAEQSAALTPSLRAGTALLGRVMREPFNGENPGTCGRLIIELGTVPESSLPRLREAICTPQATSEDCRAPRRRLKRLRP